MELRVFDVHVWPEEVERYLAGQRRALATHGVEVQEREPWRDAPPGQVSLITAHDDAGGMVGGIRVHLRPPGGCLPIEEYLGDPSLNALLRERAHELPSQLAGLWVHPSHWRSGLADFLFLAGMARSRVLGSGWACGCGHERMLPLYRKYGASFDASRTYPYPDARYVTYVLYLDLFWPEAPAHPSRDEYLAMRAAFHEGRTWSFTPAKALAWAPPLAGAIPGSVPARAAG